MHIDERKYAYGYAQGVGDNDSATRVMKSKYDIYLYGIKNVNVTNGSTKSDWTFTYDGGNSYVGDGNMGCNIPYKYLTPGSILSITGFIVAESPGTMDIGYYPLPYFEPEDNPGSGIDIHSVVVHTNPSKTGSAITITVNKHTRCGTWQSTKDRYYYFYFKVESSGDQSV